MMDSIQDILRSTLDKLTEGQFKKFKHHLKDTGKVPWGKLKKSDSDDTVDLLVEVHTVKGSERVIMQILKRMKLNQVAMDMGNELEKYERRQWRKQRFSGDSDSDDDEEDSDDDDEEDDEEEEDVGCQRKGTSNSGPICSLHKQEVKLFCQDDRELVCIDCTNLEIHRNHNFKPISTQMLKGDLQTKMEALRKQINLCEEAKITCEETVVHAESQIEDTEAKINKEFEEIFQFLQYEAATRIAALKKEKEMKSQMMMENIEKMSREISSLSDTIIAIEGKIGADDITFLQNYKSTVERAQCTLQDPERVPGGLINVAKHLGNLKFRVWENMQEIFHYTPVTLDPNTAHPSLTLSGDLTSVTCDDAYDDYTESDEDDEDSDESQQLPDNPERFDEYSSVLGSEGFNSGTHAWDVVVRESTSWEVGVMTESLQRKGEYDSESGNWYMSYDDDEYTAWPPKTPLTVKQAPQRIRVQLNWDRGEVSFSDPDNNTHLHTLTYNFTERVFPYFNGGPLKILPVALQLHLVM